MENRTLPSFTNSKSTAPTEAFDVYHEGVALHLQWGASLPPLERPSALRLCAVSPDLLLLLTVDGCLYTAQKDAVRPLIYLELQRTEVADIGYCRQTQQLFLVTLAGSVCMQQFGYRPGAWQTLSFDPLELSEDGIRVQRVCCSAQGVLFVTHACEVYVMGSCGELFSSEVQPKHLRLFDEGREVLDLAAGDDFFLVLLQRAYEEREDPLDLCAKRVINRPVPPAHSLQPAPTQLPTSDATKQSELNSNSSLRSYSSSKSSTNSHAEQDFETRIRELLKHGYALLHTQLASFGAENRGLLGTGDHIKRSAVSQVQKLNGVGVCSIAAGREHAIARTLDGRLYHWGLNSRQQLNGRLDLSDLSAPTELKLDRIELDAMQRNILATSCGDYRSVLLNARGELHEKEKFTFQTDLLALQMSSSSGGAGTSRCKSLPLLLAADAYTLHNRRQLQRDYHSHLAQLQAQLRQMLAQRHVVEVLRVVREKSPAAALKQLLPVCQSFERLLCLTAAAVHSLERFYRGDYDSVADLLFVRQYRECIELFEAHSHAYCDMYSIDAYAEAAKVFGHFSAVPLVPPSSSDEAEPDLARIFQQPFQVFPIFIQFIEKLSRTRSEFTEHGTAWQSFADQSRIELELAENTRDFWQRNERNLKIRHFRRKQRRVILTSATLPLKLAGNALSMSSTTFILFSDCLCQVSSNQLHTYPLVALWLKIESDTALRIITPERNFTLVARSHHDKLLWKDQLEAAVNAALGRPSAAKMSHVRTTAFVFGRNHAKYAGVHAFGRWRNGVLHGNCYLEYPDGRFYFGEMSHGEIEGFGKMVIPSVGLYEGFFKAGKFHGHGTYEMRDNEIYEGHFRDGLFHGHGLLRTNSYTYVGEYQGNQKCGYGILDDFVTGDKYMGMFVDSKRTGAGTCITMNGDYFEGIFVNDELAGTGIAVFENEYYYEGELTMRGPSGKGTYYMPSGSVEETEDSGIADDDEFVQRQLIGNVLSGQLGGSWNDVRVVSGTVAINRQFPKYPKSIGDLVVGNNRKWRSLFENFESQIMDATTATASTNKKPDNSINATKHLWSRFAIFMTTQREREKAAEQQDSVAAAYQSTHSYFARNISLGFSGTSSFDKISLKSTNSLFTAAKSSILDLGGSGGGGAFADARRSHSQETLYDAELNDLDFVNACYFPNYHNEENSFSSLLNAQFGNWANDSSTTGSTRSSFDSVLNLSGSLNNNSFSSQSGLEFVPSFGVTSLTEHDVAAIKEYLAQAFKDRHHPLFLLNQRISNCFYTSYGCWKVKPTPILAKQAMREWESISKRVYAFVRKMFPALPEDFCIVEPTREVVSHITLLYPIVLTEGIYSTLFVLYANKYSRKDEMYRQNLMYAENLLDNELTQCLCLESSLLPVVSNNLFGDAIQTLKQLQEKYSPKAMLTVIENCMQQITEAHKLLESKTAILLAADSMMPLTLFLVLRAAVPHLGAELALLDDLTGGSNFQHEMNGIAGYCFTTLKACYEHLTAKSLKKT